MEESEILKKYKLSKKEHEKYYTNIKKAYIRGKKTVKNPIAVIIGGQTGAGKCGLINYSKKIFKDSNVIIINGDEIRLFHPKSKEIARLYPDLYTKITCQDSNLWTKKLFKELRKKRFNIIFEGTMKNNIIATESITELQQLGYIVIVRGLAVSDLESRISILERYEEQVNQNGWGRLVIPEQHNETYKGMPETINYIEKEKKYDILEIFSRGENPEKPITIYAKYDLEKKEYIEKIIKENLEYKTICQYESAKEAVLKTREIESNKIRLTLNKRIVAVLKSMKKRKATEKEKKIVLDLLAYYQTIKK